MPFSSLHFREPGENQPLELGGKYIQLMSYAKWNSGSQVERVSPRVSAGPAR